MMQEYFQHLNNYQTIDCISCQGQSFSARNFQGALLLGKEIIK